MHANINKFLLYYPATFLKRQWIPKYYNSLNISQWHSSEQLEQIQLEKLLNLLLHAKINVPYYKEVLNAIDINLIDSISELHQIPILTKEAIKNNLLKLLYTKEKGIQEKTTGGSTGNPVTVYQSADAVGAADAAYWRGYAWAGVKICDRQGRFWGIPHDKTTKKIAQLKDFILNRLRFSAFSFDEKTLKSYYDRLNHFKPKYLYGYVSMITAVAKYLKAHDLDLQFQLTAIITTSEVLTVSHRKLFEDIFKCKVFNEYGCGEVGTIAHECEHGSLHINSENLLVEILQNGKAVKPGEQGDIVVTSLNNTAMPLIRYNLKDIGFISKENCKCGRGLPVLGGVVGRAYDTIFNKEGKAFHGEFFMYIFEELQIQNIQVMAFQVIQENYENFVIKVVMKKEDIHIMKDYINRRVQDAYGDYAKIQYELVSEIQREHSGKIRLIKSLVTRNL